MSVFPTNDNETRILDVVLQNKILLCTEEKSNVKSALYAAQALKDYSAWQVLIFLFLHQRFNLQLKC